MKPLEADNRVVDVPLDDIVVSKNNARTIDLFFGLEELANSIREIGLQQPVVLLPIKGKEGKYELIIGQRRFLAYKNFLKDRKTIRAVILKKPMNDLDALAYSFSENIHRHDLEYKDKVAVAMKLFNVLGNVKAVADKLNVHENTVRKYLGWAAAPEELKELVEKKKLSKQTAMRIAKTNKDPERAIAIAKQVIEAPRRKLRDAIIQTSIENPTYTPEEVSVEAQRAKFKQITLNLTDAVAAALEKASTKYDLEPNELATQILTEYLQNEGFFL